MRLDRGKMPAFRFAPVRAIVYPSELVFRIVHCTSPHLPVGQRRNGSGVPPRLVILETHMESSGADESH